VKERELARRGRRWEHNIKTDLKETGWQTVDSIHVARVRVKWLAFANTVMNLQGNL
jgi:hypothetical protein